MDIKMPYISKEAREAINEQLEPFLKYVTSMKHSYRAGNTGNLNYVLTKIILATEPENYEEYNAILGILTTIQHELYRRRIAKYEEEKISKNGDVY